MINPQSAENLGRAIATSIQNQILDNKSVRTGTLWRSVNSNVDGNTITVSMVYYGQFVDEGHKTRLGTSKNPNYKPNPMHTQAYVAAKPFINKGIDNAIEENLPIFIDDLILNIIK